MKSKIIAVDWVWMSVYSCIISYQQNGVATYLWKLGFAVINSFIVNFVGH